MKIVEGRTKSPVAINWPEQNSVAWEMNASGQDRKEDTDHLLHPCPAQREQWDWTLSEPLTHCRNCHNCCGTAGGMKENAKDLELTKIYRLLHPPLQLLPKGWLMLWAATGEEWLGINLCGHCTHLTDFLPSFLPPLHVCFTGKHCQKLQLALRYDREQRDSNNH